MSGKYNSNRFKVWSRFEKLPEKIECLGLSKLPWMIIMENGTSVPLYGYDCYRSYFYFSICEDDKTVFAEVYDHDDDCWREDLSETLFEYEGDNFEEWSTGKENFEEHQKEWELWKEFVKLYNSYF